MFLPNYRATPHTKTGFSPSHLLFNRLIKTKQPQIVRESQAENHAIVLMKDQQAKAKMKENADTKRRAKHSTIQIGDIVLLRQRKQNKFSMKFDPSPYWVTHKKGTMLTATRNGRSVTRNTSLFKKVNQDVDHMGAEESDDDLASDEPDVPVPVPVPIPIANDLPRYPVRSRQSFRHLGQNIYE